MKATIHHLSPLSYAKLPSTSQERYLFHLIILNSYCRIQNSRETLFKQYVSLFIYCVVQSYVLHITGASVFLILHVWFPQISNWSCRLLCIYCLRSAYCISWEYHATMINYEIVMLSKISRILVCEREQ